MKKYTSVLIVLVIILLGTYSKVFAEGKIDSLFHKINLKRATKAYNNTAYVKAIDIYSQLVSKNFISSDIYRNLAVSYYKIGNTVKAEEYYQYLLNIEYEPRDVYNYAQTLKYNGRYVESDQWMKKYADLNIQDSRVERQANTNDKINDIKSVSKFDIETVAFNSKYADFGPTLYDDKLYFASERKENAVLKYEYAWKQAPYLDIYELNLKGEIVTNPQFLKGKVNSKYHDGPMCFSKDGKEIFFTRNNSIFRVISKKGEDNVNHLKIYYARYVNGELSNPVELSFNSENYSCGHPTLSANGSILYFTSDMPGGYGGSDIYRTQRTGSSWSKPENLGPIINTEGDEMFPFIHESGTLFFASNGHLGLGGLDIFKADMGGKYTVENIGHPINSNKDDFALIIDKEQKEGYFSSNREGGAGDDDIYKFFTLEVSLLLQGKVFDQETKEHVENASVVLNDSKGESIRLMSSSDEFDFRIEVDPKEKYTLGVNREEYKSFTASVIPGELNIRGNIAEYNIYLTKIPVWGIYGKVYYKETLKEIPDINIQVENVSTGKSEEYRSDNEGFFRIHLDQNTDYKLLLSKEGVFSIRSEYTTKGKSPGWVMADEFIELAFEKIELNKKIEIPNIYYDLGKWNIRQDAAKELDNVVQFLTDNPNIKIELGSHTDARGSAGPNQSLSQKRAQSAVDYIVSKGIVRSRITAKGYGESQIKNRCKDGIACSEAEHQENRRTEIRITGI